MALFTNDGTVTVHDTRTDAYVEPGEVIEVDDADEAYYRVIGFRLLHGAPETFRVYPDNGKRYLRRVDAR